MHLLWAVVCLGGSIAAAQGTRIDHRGLREAGPASLPKDDNTRSTLQNRRVAGAVSSLSPRLRKRFPARPRMPRFSKAYWEDWWKRRPEELPDKGNNNHECFINLKRYVMSRGDRDDRRDQYLISKCLEMHGMDNTERPVYPKAEPRRTTIGKQVADWTREPSRPLPLRSDGSPRFSAVYWEGYFDLHPDEMPDKGASLEECIANLEAFVRAKGDSDGRRFTYIDSICRERHGIPPRPRRSSRQANSDGAQQPGISTPSAQDGVGDSGSTPVSEGNIDSGEEEPGLPGEVPGEASGAPTRDDANEPPQREIRTGVPEYRRRLRRGTDNDLLDRGFQLFIRYFGRQPRSRGTVAPDAAAHDRGWASPPRARSFMPRGVF